MEGHYIPSELVRKAGFLACLDEQSRDLVRRTMVALDVRAGEVVCHEGQEGDCAFLVENGELSVTKTAPDGRLVEIARLGTGELVGEMSLFDHSPRSASVQAISDGRLWRLSAVQMEQLLESHPATARTLLSCLSDRLRRENLAVASLRDGELDRRFKIAMFDTKSYTKSIFKEVNADRYALTFLQPKLSLDTVALARGVQAVCVFVNDRVDGQVVAALNQLGVSLIALRCAGYNNVDLPACHANGLEVVRVPAYSPYAVAEHAVALMLALNRKTHRAHNRVRDGNFSLEGLVGFDMHGKTVGVIGAGRIGSCAINILLGFGCNVLLFSPSVDEELARRPGVRYVSIDELYRQSDIISLHLPLTPKTRHMIDAKAISLMKTGTMLINTSRGGLVDTAALIEGLKSGKIGSTGLDVYEEESGYFFEDFSGSIISDDALARLLTFNNVMVTSHQAFLTQEALRNIAATTLDNVAEFEHGKRGDQLSNGLLQASA